MSTIKFKLINTLKSHSLTFEKSNMSSLATTLILYREFKEKTTKTKFNIASFR